MKILTIPPTNGGDSHLIPLFVLHKRYIQRLNFLHNTFLTAMSSHKDLISKGVKVVNIDNSIYAKDFKKIEDKDELKKTKLIGLKIQENIFKAFEQIRPDIIIEDLEPFTVLPCEKFKIKRISICRTGHFRSLPNHLRNRNHIHSSESNLLALNGKKEESLKANIIFSPAYMNSQAKIIPGIPSIEVLPENIKNRDSYFYTGPLLVEDNPSKSMEKELNDFFNVNKDNRIVFITVGLIDVTSLTEYIELLLNKNYSVISTVKIELDNEFKEKYFYSKFFPLNFICSRVDLIIHQCGSGIYHYPILNEKPAITIGTMCYDREDVAIRLELMKVSQHVPHLNDNEDCIDIFKKCLKSFEDKTLCDFNKLRELKQEIYETMLNFDIQEVINYVTKHKK